MYINKFTEIKSNYIFSIDQAIEHVKEEFPKYIEIISTRNDDVYEPLGTYQIYVKPVGSTMYYSMGYVVITTGLDYDARVEYYEAKLRKLLK